MAHVDVVKNEWLAGYQVVVGRVWANRNDADVRVDAHDPWPEVILAYQGAEESGDFLEDLHKVMRGDYLFATAPHEDADCPYREMVVPLRTATRPRTQEEYAPPVAATPEREDEGFAPAPRRGRGFRRRFGL